jgi:hypothetical protein
MSTMLTASYYLHVPITTVAGWSARLALDAVYNAFDYQLVCSHFILVLWHVTKEFSEKMNW